MPYVQIMLQDGFITRSPSIIRDQGYPAYVALQQMNRGLVRTILYEDESGIYLTDKKDFILTTDTDGDLIFSSRPGSEPIIPQGRRYPWRDEWANMGNSQWNRDGLIHPYDNAIDVWDLVASRGYNMTMATGGNYISYTHPCRFRCEDYGYFISGSNRATFRLKKYGSEYGLEYDDVGRTIGSGGRRDVKCWNAGGACRWMIHGSVSTTYPIMKFKPEHRGGPSYHLVSGGRKLSASGSWYIASQIMIVNNGVEFYTNPPVSITPTVEGMSAADMYRVGSFMKYTGRFNPLNVRENMPDGISCTSTYWDGHQLQCHGEQIPYTSDLGSAQCQTLDDFSSDIHCQVWARANAGPTIERRLRQLCADQEPDGPYSNICNCYLPDDIYYNIILERSGDRVASGVKASSLLQCASGLCSGSGTLGEDIFYSGSRRCDVCIQVMTTNINADRIEGGVSLRQQCTHVDATYTWDQLITDLISYGAYHQNKGIHRHVVINDRRDAIMLVTPNPIKTTLLASIPRSNEFYIILTRDRWAQSPTAFSNEVLSFLLEGRE